MSRIVVAAVLFFAGYGLFVAIDLVTERAGWWLRDLLELRRSIVEEHDAQARAAVRRRDLTRSQIR